ncbi:hypothetical protein FE257_000208 [Aspergillus nanangensis]|uniref:VOC domain-containing protein n=1 Tax=Aspergillus nanangensis TaxID=2582783 RepID=A0AAD4GYV8_ASPNN|nr:hypothetical protein FE257_000208 [Aspergillus nanangensis]
MPKGRIPPVSNSPNKIQLDRLSHVAFAHPDLQEFDAFAHAFGFEIAHRTETTIYYRGWGKDAYAYVAHKADEKKFLGATFVAKTQADFEKCARLEGASVVRENEGPGGGKIVTVVSPSKMPMHVLWGQVDRPLPEKPVTATEIHKGEYNTALVKLRKGEYQRFKVGPGMIHKLGHYGYLTRTFDEDIEFYTGNFNFVPSDIVYEETDGAQVDTLTFMHLDQGKDYVDHHTLFLSRVPDSYPEEHRLHHCSFEVEDFDTQLLAHEHLLQRGYNLVWGVGRHILGSQIFDYWKDPSGFTIEHYADGDVVNVDNATGREKSEGAASMYIWGPIRPEAGVAT